MRLTWQGGGVEIAFEICKCFLAFFSPLEVLGFLQSLKEGKASLSQPGDDPIEGGDPFGEALDVFNHPCGPI